MQPDPAPDVNEVGPPAGEKALPHPKTTAAAPVSPVENRRRKTLPYWLLAGLFLGTNLGAVADLTAGVEIDPTVLVAWRDCGWCVMRVGEVLAEVAGANRGLLVGGLLGLAAGVAGWGLVSNRSLVPLINWLWPLSRGRCPYCRSGRYARIHRRPTDRRRFWRPVKRYRCRNCKREFLAARSRQNA